MGARCRDQFSFFIALYEALYRSLPFTGDTVGALAVSVTRGKPAEPTSGEVPSWIRAVVMRGLARAPADRFPDMAAVLVALDRDPARRRRRLAAVLGLVVASGGVSAGAMSLVAADGGRCEGVAAATAEVWNDERIASAGAAFASRAGVLGEETWSLIQPRIGGWIDEWVRLRGERCAAYAAGELSDTLHDRSVACLERQLARVDALVTAFVVADATSVEQAPVAVAALPSLTMCSDSEALLAEVPPPDDPRAREKVASARASLERARAAIDLGDHASALRQATAVAEDGRALAYEPLVALAEVIRGDALQWMLDIPGSMSALGTALELGLASGDDRVAVEALARRIYVRAELAGEPAAALVDASIDRALLRRVPGDPRLAWLVENNIAVAEERVGRAEAAISGHAAAQVIAAEIGGGVSFEAMVSQYNRGLVRGQRGDPERAATEIFGAVTTAERLYGPNHPALLTLFEGYASALFELGRLREAAEMCRRARSLAARSQGVNPTLLPIIELEAKIAGSRRLQAADTLAEEAFALATAVYGASGARTSYSTLRVSPYHEEREEKLTALRASLKASSPALWADTAVFRIEARIDAGQPARALIDEIRADEAWASVSPRLRITIGLLVARAALDEGRTADAARELDEVEVLGRDEPPFAMQMQVDHIRGELATRAGAPQAAVVLLRRAAEGCATFDEDHPRRLAVRAALARALRASGASVEAEEVARDVIRLYRSLGAGFEPEASALAGWLRTMPTR